MTTTRARTQHTHRHDAPVAAPDSTAADTTPRKPRTLRLGSVHVWPVTCPAAPFERRPRTARRAEPEVYHLRFPSEQPSGGTRLALRDAAPAPVAIHLEMPRRLVSLPEDHVSRLVADGFPAREGSGALLTGLLTRLTRDTAEYSATALDRLERVIVDLFTAALAQRLEAEEHGTPQVRAHMLAPAIEAYILRSLPDPELTPRSIAAAHHISPGHLHRVFRTLGHHATPSSWIRAQRLERIRADLTDPVFGTAPIHEVAARWGMTDPATFSRVFRAAFGLSPREYRHRALGKPAVV
ncbi:helix-turn-helix transcriptional regulator [Streptomyces avicenniae]|uniref:helix-turn-helix transcriptional regulator n=1 Tax=Streptomyces avicenniae TaxID=500153 RepID=UPI00069AAC3E|nr:helix-turn-helix transcriptional regulator [Streptomyces avicenniae]